MKQLRTLRGVSIAAGLVLASGLAAGTASAYTAPYSTPAGITLVDVSQSSQANPDFLWRRLGDATGNPLYTYDADQTGRSSCYSDCAKEFPPLVADTHAKASGDWSIVTRDDHVSQWAYQGKPLYRYSGKDPAGEPVSGLRMGNPEFHDPASKFFSPKSGWRRAAYTPEKSVVMPSNVELDWLAVANGFGFVDAATHMPIYAAPVSHKLSSDWHPVYASALSLPVDEFSIIERKDDGTRQWTYKGAALYTYAGDYVPGELTGIFTADKSIQAALAYRNFMPPGIDIGHYPGRGPLMTTAKGQTLYTVARFHALYGGRETRTGYYRDYNDLKSQGTEGCQGDCTATWKPVLAAANAEAGGFWEMIGRPDGSKQWAFKGSPVYSYIGDKKPGDIEGNNRHVIVYGGPQGQVVYANTGGDPRSPQPRLDKINMVFAVGPGVRDGAGGGANAGAGAAAGAPAKPGAPVKPGDAAAAAAALAASQTALNNDTNLGGPGAGFYWHTVPLL